MKRRICELLVIGLIFVQSPALAQDRQWQSGTELVRFLDEAYASGEHSKVITELLHLAGQAKAQELYQPGLDWVNVAILERGAPSSYAAAYMTMLWWARSSEPELRGTAAMMYVYALTRRFEAAARCDDNGVAPSLQAIQYRGQEVARWIAEQPVEQQREILGGAMLTTQVAPMHDDEFKVCTGGSGYMLRYMEKHGEDGMVVRKGPGNVTHVQPGYDPELIVFVDDLEWQKRRADIRARLTESFRH